MLKAESLSGAQLNSSASQVSINDTGHYTGWVTTPPTSSTTETGYMPTYEWPWPPQPVVQVDPKPSIAQGTKFDSAKPDFSLIDPFASEGLAKVLTFGKVKYGAYNWLKGIAYSRLIAATERHLNAIKKGEDTDPESGLPHVDHAMCNLMFLSRFMKTKPELDDRPEENKEGKVMF